MNFYLKFERGKMKKKIKSDDKTLIEIYLRVAQKFAQNDKLEKYKKDKQ
jgi:hypothetical protein|nr:MAG TPA_asm: hypothetical protein [Caudoviricetes sp.]